MDLKEAREKYGKVKVFACEVEDDEGVVRTIDVIARRPNRGEVMRFGSGLMGDSKIEALEGLVQCCVVSPPVEALLDEHYGIVFSLGNSLAAWCGVGRGVEQKKA
jgi:hypothetical protein